MNKPLIVGVWHDPRTKTLLNEECRIAFGSRILHSITAHTLLLIEGHYDEPYYAADHRKYQNIRWEIQDFLGIRLANSPTFAWRDARCIAHQAKKEDCTLFDYSKRCIRPRIAMPPPTSMAELVSSFRDTTLPYEIRGEEPEGLREYCEKILSWNDRFDAMMMSEARAWEATGRPAMIICGAIHALTMHRTTGWPVCFLIDRPEPTQILAEKMVALVLYPERILGKTPAIADSFAPVS